VKKILLFPYNGNALEAVDCLSDEYECIGFIDDTPHKQGRQSNGYTVFSREVLDIYKEARVLAVPGSPASYLMRQQYIDSLQVPAERFTTIIHPKAVVGSQVQIGYNVLIMAGVVITSNAIIEDHVCILPNSVIHHDSIIGRYSLVGSNVIIAGGTSVGKNCYIGSGSNIIHEITIGEKALIGLGSNVINNVESGVKVAGNPAKKLN
jgi:sugar O-acyltransferase (sialic acid O-acetyltransferase NeuD family)